MQTVELKLIVEALAKNADNFASQYEMFKKMLYEIYRNEGVSEMKLLF